MTTAPPRPRRGGPYNPALAEYQRQLQEAEDVRKRDRRSTDLLRNARVVPVEVDDPMGDGKVVVMRSTRDDPLADMLARGHITECEFATGRHWQRAYEDAEIGGIAAVDPGKECVDGGRMREVLTDRQIAATKELNLAREKLGDAGNWLIVSVLGTKKTIEAVAFEWKEARPGDAKYRYVRNRFHECLGTLSVLFGYAMPTRA